MPQKTFVNAKYLSSLFALNAGFFYLYNTKLALGFSWFGLIFIFLFVFNFFIAFVLFRGFVVRTVMLGAFVALVVYALINFAYFEVFNTFLDLSMKRASAVNQPLLALLKDFYVIVPSLVYLASLGLVLFFTAALVLHSRRLNRYYLQLDTLAKRIDFLREERRNRVSTSRLVPIILFLVINFSCGLYVINSRQEIVAGTVNRQDYFAKVGLLGHIFYNAYDFVGNEIGQIFSPVTMAESGNSANIFEQIRLEQQRLAQLGNDKIVVENIKLPQLEKPNIIFYQLESVGAWALKQDPSPMPFFSKLIADNLSVDKFYSNSCTTNNAEFAAMCGFYPESFGPISDLYSGNDYNCLPSILKSRHGYQTSMFHANDSDFWNRTKLGPSWGIDNMYFSPLYKPRTSDYVVVEDMVNKMASSSAPTFNYFVSFFTHAPHEQKFIDFYRSSEGIEVKPYDKPLNIKNKVSTDEPTIRNYFGFLEQEDLAIKHLFEQLAAKQLLNNTIVVFYTDHRYYPFEVGGDELERLEDYNLLPFVMYLPERYQGQNKAVASQVDIAPTVMNLIEGNDYDLPESFVGSSLLSANHPQSALNKCLGEAIYTNRDIVVKKDLTLGNFTVVRNLNQYSKFKEQDYQRSLESLIKLTDRAVQNNLLGATSNSSTTAESHNTSRSIDLNQMTDTDKDGLSDMREKALGTNRKNPDSDNDGYKDGEELLNGYNPLGPGRLQ